MARRKLSERTSQRFVFFKIEWCSTYSPCSQSSRRNLLHYKGTSHGQNKSTTTSKVSELGSGNFLTSSAYRRLSHRCPAAVWRPRRTKSSQMCISVYSKQASTEPNPSARRSSRRPSPACSASSQVSVALVIPTNPIQHPLPQLRCSRARGRPLQANSAQIRDSCIRYPRAQHRRCHRGRRKNCHRMYRRALFHVLYLFFVF